MAYRRSRYGRAFRRRSRWRSPLRRFGFKRRYRRYRRRSGINATRSRTVRISSQINMPFTIQASNESYYPLPVCFTPSQLSGFLDYSRNYSEFRILKAVCKVHLALPDDSATGANLSNNPYAYLRVASRPFLEGSAVRGPAGQGGSPASMAGLLAARQVTVGDLRQSMWQKQYYPSDIKNSLSFKFYPYTLEWQGRPVGNYSTTDSSADSLQYLKWKSARRWMPMSFLGVQSSNGQGQPTTPGDDVSFLGPYFVRLLGAQNDGQALQAFQPVVELQVWCQFRGQR